MSPRNFVRIATRNDSGLPRGVDRRQCSSTRQHASIGADGVSSHTVTIASVSSVSVQTDGLPGTGSSRSACDVPWIECPTSSSVERLVLPERVKDFIGIVCGHAARAGVRTGSSHSAIAAFAGNSGHASAINSRRFPRARAIRLFTVPSLVPSARAICP